MNVSKRIFQFYSEIFYFKKDLKTQLANDQS